MGDFLDRERQEETKAKSGFMREYMLLGERTGNAVCRADGWVNRYAYTSRGKRNAALGGLSWLLPPGG